ncbi:MAG: hypothetical protein HY362_03630 [Candidatus Aenigmarchaeota archaeon]|nr:hypothetical protein [Candidatus Aenigmarchaeota archaeon]
MEMPRAYVRTIDPPLFRRILGDIKRTGEYKSRNTIYKPTEAILWSGVPPIQSVNEYPMPGFTEIATLILIPITRTNDKGAPDSDTMYRCMIQKSEAGKTTLSVCPVAELSRDGDTTVRMTLMDLSYCNTYEVLEILKRPKAIGTREGELSGFIGRQPYYLGIEENPFV